MDILLWVIGIPVAGIVLYILVFGVGSGLLSAWRGARSGDWDGQAQADKDALAKHKEQKQRDNT